MSEPIKKPKRELKVKNLFSDNPAETPASTTIQPSQSTLLSAPVQSDQPVPNPPVQAPPPVVRPPAPPTPSAPHVPLPPPLRESTIPPAKPVTVVPAFVTPKSTPDSHNQTNTQRTNNIDGKEQVHSNNTPPQPIQVPPVQQGPTAKVSQAPDPKKSKLQQLKSKYLKKSIPPATTTQTSSFDKPVPATSIQVQPENKSITTPKPVLPIQPVPKEVQAQVAVSPSAPLVKAPPVPPKPIQIISKSPQSQKEDVPTHNNAVDFFQTLSQNQDSPSHNSPITLSAVQPRPNPPVPVFVEPTHQIKTDFNSIIAKKVVSPPPVPARPPKREIGVYRDPLNLKGSYPTSSQPNNQQHNIPDEAPVSEASLHHQQLVYQSSQQEIDSKPIPQQANIPLTSKQRPFVPPSFRKETNTPIVTQKIPQNYASQNFHPNTYIQSGLDVQVDWRQTKYNHVQLVKTIHQKVCLHQETFRLILQLLGQSVSSQNFVINTHSNNPAFTPWVQAFFRAFVVDAHDIEPQNHQLILDFLNEFFSPVSATLSPAYFTTLIKLDPRMYEAYIPEILNNLPLYCKYMRNCALAENVKTNFLKKMARHLAQSYHGTDYCRRALHMFYECPAILGDEVLDPYLKESANDLEFSALLYLLLNKISTKTKNYPKAHIVSLNQIIKELEKEQFYEDALELLKPINEVLGTIAYANFKETRDRLISKISGAKKQNSETKESGSGLFGFFGQALQKIKVNTAISKPESAGTQQSSPSPQLPKKESIYYDPEKKRYVLNGQIPEDEEETKPTTSGPSAVPPPPTRNVVPPPPPAGGMAPKKPGSRIPANRYVASSGTPNQ